MTSEMETNIVAVERIKEYSETPTEVSQCIIRVVVFSPLLAGFEGQKNSELGLSWEQMAWGISPDSFVMTVS